MKRASLILSAGVGFAGVAQAQAPAGGPQPGATQQARPVVAVFNMAAVMRDYNKAKYQVHLLNEQRVAMSGDIATLKQEYIRLQNDAKSQQVPAEQEKIGKRKRGTTVEDMAAALTEGIDKRKKKNV